MSGHSKWATIKRDKALNDSKKGATFTKFSKDISISSKAGGGDPATNAALFAAIAKAKSANMPNDKIQKAIDKGTGVSKSGLTIHSLSYEAYGPGDIAVIIDASTDNKNRTNGEIKSTIEKNGGRFVEGGTVAWLFETKGMIFIPFETSEERKKREGAKWGAKEELIKLDLDKYDDFELFSMELDGVLDIQKDNDGVTIMTSPELTGKVRKSIEENGTYVDDSEIIKSVKNPVDADDATVERLKQFVERLEDNDDVENIWTALS